MLLHQYLSFAADFLLFGQVAVLLHVIREKFQVFGGIGFNTPACIEPDIIVANIKLVVPFVKVFKHYPASVVRFDQIACYLRIPALRYQYAVVSVPGNFIVPDPDILTMVQGDSCSKR